MQAAVLPVADRHLDYAREVRGAAARGGRPGAIDDRSESVGKKVHDAEVAKLPYMLVVGDREQEAGAVSVRSHGEGDLGQMSVEELADRMTAETLARAGERRAIQMLGERAPALGRERVVAGGRIGVVRIGNHVRICGEVPGRGLHATIGAVTRPALAGP